MGLAGLNGLRALADRNGSTSLEYAMIAAAIAGIVLVAFQAYFARVHALIDGLSI